MLGRQLGGEPRPALATHPNAYGFLFASAWAVIGGAPGGTTEHGSRLPSAGPMRGGRWEVLLYWAIGPWALRRPRPSVWRRSFTRSRFAHVAWGLSAILGAGSPLAARFSPSVGSQSLAARSRTERGRLTRPLVRTDHKSPRPRIVDRSAGRLPRRRSLTTGGPGETEVDGGRPTLLVREVMAPSWQINRQVTASGIWCPVGGAGVGLRTRGRWFWIGGRCRGDRMVG